MTIHWIHSSSEGDKSFAALALGKPGEGEERFGGAQEGEEKATIIARGAHENVLVPLSMLRN